MASPPSAAPAAPPAPAAALLFLEVLPHELAVDAHGQFFAVYPLRLASAAARAAASAAASASASAAASSAAADAASVVVRKRYRNFQDLDGLLRALPAAHRPQRKDLPVLTSKRWGAGLRDDVIDKRRRKLAEYLHEFASLAAGYPAVAALLQTFLRDDAAGRPLTVAERLSRAISP